MNKSMLGFPARLKELRQNMGYTQNSLAKKLSLTRASINAWEMGLSAPSTPYLAELSELFHVTADYLLGLDECVTIRTDNLSKNEISILLNLVEVFNQNKAAE